MIVNIKDTIIEVNVAHKCGVSTSMAIVACAFTTTEEDRLKLNKKRSTFFIGDNFIHNSTYFVFDKNIYSDIKIAIVRNPIKRIRSIWSDRIKKKNKPGLEDTSFEYFYNNFYALHKCEDIRKHSQPQISYIGVNSNYYDHIFDISELNTKYKQLIEDLSNVEIPDIFANNSDYSDFNVTKEQYKYFRHVYSLDYHYYGKYFK